MRLYVLILLSFFEFSISCHGQTKTYTIDTDSSKVGFNVSHLGVLNVNGTFREFEGEINFVNNAFSAIEANIIVNSIFTDNKSRDKTLLGKSYFNATFYPLIRFESRQVKLLSNEIIGNLTIKNETRPIVLSFQLSEAKQEISLLTKISRKHFNLKFGSMDSLIGDIVEIDVIIGY